MLKALELPNFFFSSFSTKTKKNSFASEPNSLRVWLGMFLAIINIGLLMSYLAGVNGYAATGYEIKKLQNRYAQLSEENKKMNIKISEVSSMAAIQSDFEKSDFVPAGTPKFLRASQFTYSGKVQTNN